MAAGFDKTLIGEARVGEGPEIAHIDLVIGAKAEAENLLLIVSVFIEWDTMDKEKVRTFNYEATKLAIKRAMRSEPSADEVLAKKCTAKHPFCE
jgi:formaldehyde-activating enzyme involved in methanogenesis